ncbi:MAG: hypothetical protein KTR22_00995 [Flavobacteriaceae bacterium]|nr:hypothetical protein [Flavobacteriaceae bacterium]
MKKTIKYTQPLNKFKAFFATVLILLSLYLAFDNGFLYGLIILGLGVRFALRHGVEVRLEGLVKYRNTYSLFGWTIGTWKALPEIEYISVFKTKKKTRSRGVTAEVTLDSIVYKVNLFHNTNKHIEVYEAEEKEEAFTLAKQLQEALGCEIHDAT